MSQFSAPATLTTPWGTISFNPAAGGNGYYLTRALGLGQAPLRIVVDDKPQTDGGIVHPPKRGARHPTVEGYILPVVGPTLVSMMNDLQAALESIEGVDGTWTWTDDSAPAKHLTVQAEIGVDFDGARPKTFAFGLVAGNPALT